MAPSTRPARKMFDFQPGHLATALGRTDKSFIEPPSDLLNGERSESLLTFYYKFQNTNFYTALVNPSRFTLIN